MKLTCNKIKEFIRDEEKGVKDYKEFELNSLANDEYKHSKFLKNKYKKECSR